MRDDDVKNLCEYEENRLVDIKKTYEQSLQNKDIPVSLRIDIKNNMENLRSALDYIAQDVNETIIIPYRKKNNMKLRRIIYFPYGQNEQDFNESIQRNLPDLKTISLDIYFQ